MISLVRTSVGAATQYIPFSPFSGSSPGSRQESDLSLNLKSSTTPSPSSSHSSSSSTAYSSAASSTTSTACSSPASSPTTSAAPFPPPPAPTHRGPRVATNDPPSSSSSSSSSTPSSSSSSTPSTSQHSLTSGLSDEERKKYAVIHQILRASDLYVVLDVERRCDANALRRAYMRRCKACHPDKYPTYPLATVAFQKVSFAYNILSTPSSRRMYDLHGTTPEGSSDSFSFDANSNLSAEDINLNFTHPSHTARADETLSGVLLGVFLDFMEGDFQMLRTFLRAMNEVNPALNISDETIENLVGTFVRLREVLLTTQKYIRILHIELIQLHEIQHNLRALSYLDVFGRLRLTLRLARCTLALPCVVDAVMIREAEEAEEKERMEEMERAAAGEDANDEREGITQRRKRPRSSDGLEDDEPTPSQRPVPLSSATTTAGASSSTHPSPPSSPKSSTSRASKPTSRRASTSSSSPPSAYHPQYPHNPQQSQQQQQQRKRRPRVRTSSTSGPRDDAPFIEPSEDLAPGAAAASAANANGERGGPGPERRKRKGGLLHPRVSGMIQSACKVLEYGESVL
ncbi:DnaJ-domain-containing protein [Clavulina sp. PMI_390]|nr:DnaJ-domain-containing protein [Clavulina sp. PMI_390]